VANHKSAKKRAKQTIVKTARNKDKSSEVKSVVKAIRAAIASSDKEAATALFPKTQAVLAKLAKNGILKNNTVARRTARLARQINRL
jgi:small subunit ribosomal protein S20